MIYIKSGLDFQNILNTDVNVSSLPGYLVLQILSADERNFNKVKSLPKVKWHINSEVELGFRTFLALNHKLSSLVLPLFRFSHSAFNFVQGLNCPHKS